MDKLKLYGFNNLTKSLSFNIYDICYAKTEKQRQQYVEYIDEEYSSARITAIIKKIVDMIGAEILNVSSQDYDPQGASVAVLIAENRRKTSEILAHLDKSHVTVHTYPEFHPDSSIATFRVDIDVATCGEISPLSTLDYLIDSFDSDIITMDYRVRGFTRNLEGEKIFIDHPIDSIQDYIEEETLNRYEVYDINVDQANLFHTKMKLKEIILEDYLFHLEEELDEEEKEEITESIRQEMMEIFHGKNLY
ncbi:MAG: adenosylmethionine decarboxylase [Gallicola sp.]|uniref:adenosylmethionine decarboxylase n=1 Tax=Gallicola sp. Sow4_E12 TaxID=3438785 RepID=UPI00181B7896|nr:adenosylmethionine decarboxylase [Gallicola sp.]